MYRSAALTILPLTLTIAVAQNQPSAAAPQKSESTDYSPEHIYGPKDHVKPPRVTYSLNPDYPKAARKSGKEGTVVVWLIVGSDGLPHNVKVVRSLSADLDDAAVDAAKKWRFAPATKDGKPVSVQINIEIPFKP